MVADKTAALSKGVPVTARRFPGQSRQARLDVRTNASTATRDATREPRPENVEGAFYVDHTCIDCDTCRWMAPAVYARVGEQSAVVAQPEGEEGRKLAMEALTACPTFSIHVRDPEKGEIAAAQSDFPLAVPTKTGLYHCGFHNEASFGATSYIITRPEGNIMVDCPRYFPKLAKKIEEMGGIKWIFLTHRDDVGAHADWAKKFGAQRIIHKTEVNTWQGTVDCEVQLTGEGPWKVDEGDDVELVHTPGHTSGSISLYHKPMKTMFTGDHFAYSGRLGRLTIFPYYNKQGIDIQIESVRKLLNYDFDLILPGHGRRIFFKDAADRLQLVSEAIEEELKREVTARVG